MFLYPLGLGVQTVLHPRVITSYFFLIMLLNYPILDSHFLFNQLHKMNLLIIINPPSHPTSISHLKFNPPSKYLVHKPTHGSPMIQVDIGGHPPVPTSNWLILSVFSSTRFSVIGKILCNCGFFTYGAVLKPYKASRWILVVSHLFQLVYFGRFHVYTSFYTSMAILGL